MRGTSSASSPRPPRTAPGVTPSDGTAAHPYPHGPLARHRRSARRGPRRHGAPATRHRHPPPPPVPAGPPTRPAPTTRWTAAGARRSRRCWTPPPRTSTATAPPRPSPWSAAAPTEAPPAQRRLRAGRLRCRPAPAARRHPRRAAGGHVGPGPGRARHHRLSATLLGYSSAEVPRCCCPTGGARSSGSGTRGSSPSVPGRWRAAASASEGLRAPPAGPAASNPARVPLGPKQRRTGRVLNVPTPQPVAFRWLWVGIPSPEGVRKGEDRTHPDRLCDLGVSTRTGPGRVEASSSPWRR